MATKTKSEKRKAAGGPWKHQYKDGAYSWRVQTGAGPRFDGLVVKHSPKHGLVVHVEAMDSRSYFCDVAGILLWVYVGRDGVARISEAEDSRRGSDFHGRLALRDPAFDRPRKPKKTTKNQA